MKKSQLHLMIRKIVREEVAMAISEVITELKRPTPTTDKSLPKTKKKIIKEQQYTKNNVLNNILNETAQDDEWRNLNGTDSFTTNNMNDILQLSDEGITSNVGNNTVNPNAMISSMGLNPDEVRNILISIRALVIGQGFADAAKK